MSNSVKFRKHINRKKTAPLYTDIQFISSYFADLTLVDIHISGLSSILHRLKIAVSYVGDPSEICRRYVGVCPGSCMKTVVIVKAGDELLIEN